MGPGEAAREPFASSCAARAVAESVENARRTRRADQLGSSARSPQVYTMLKAILLVAAAFAPVQAFQPVGNALSVSGSSALTPFAPAESRTAVVMMAVPKKRQSKMKTRQRKANWFAKADLQRERALTLGRSVLSGSASSFIYNPEADDDEDDDEEDDEDDEEDDEDEEEEEEEA